MKCFADELQKAENGLLGAQLYVADCYRKGTGGAVQNDVEAARFYRKVAEHGNIRAQLILGKFYLQGRGVAKNPQEAAKWLTLAASAGDMDAQAYLVRLYFWGDVKHRYEANKWLAQIEKKDEDRADHILLDYLYGGRHKDNEKDVFDAYCQGVEQGNAEDQFHLGEFYAQGIGVSPDENKAAEYFTLAAEAGNVLAQLRLGELFGLGKGVPQNDEKMVSLYRSAANAHYAPAQYRLGECYRKGCGAAQNDKEALFWLTQSAKNGYRPAQLVLGNYYAQGRSFRYGENSITPNAAEEESRRSADEIQADHLQAAQWLHFALESSPIKANHILKEMEEKSLKDADKMSKEMTYALMNLALYYAEGIGTPKNNEKASFYFKQAVCGNNEDAQMEWGLGCLDQGSQNKRFDYLAQSIPHNFFPFYFDRLVQGKNTDAQTEWLLASLDQDNIKEKIDYLLQHHYVDPFFLGVLFYQWQARTGYLKRAVQMFRQAAHEGNADAQFNLGVLYFRGEGVKKSPHEMANWFGKAAKQGNVEAASILGQAYYQGKFLPENHAKSVQWMTLAAQGGDAYAQNFVGDCLFRGDGVLQDCVSAVAWYQKAAKQNYVEAYWNLGICYALGKGVPKDPVKAAEYNQLASEMTDVARNA